MLPLTNNNSTTTQTLVITLSGSAATTYPTVTVGSYIVPGQAKQDYSEYPSSTEKTLLASASETTIAAAPSIGQGQVKDIHYICLPNPDTASITATIAIDENGTNSTQWKGTLGVGSTAYYEDEKGWYVLDANGALVQSVATISGSWTPVLTFATPGDLSVSYSAQSGLYSKVGDLVWVNYTIITSAFTFTTASGNLRITGLPFASVNSGSNTEGSLQFAGITKAGFTQFTTDLGINTSTLLLVASGTGVGTSQVVAADTPTGGSVILRGQVTYRSA